MADIWEDFQRLLREYSVYPYDNTPKEWYPGQGGEASIFQGERQSLDPTGSIISPTPTKVAVDWKVLRSADDTLNKSIRNWLLGFTKKPVAPKEVFRGISKGAEIKMGEEYTHATPWGFSAARGGKGAFGSPSAHDVYAYPSSPETLYYRGGALAGDPLESTRILNAQGATWDQVLNKGKRLFNRTSKKIVSETAERMKQDAGSGITYPKEHLKDLREWEARKIVDDIRLATFEADVGNKPGIWRQQVVPQNLRKTMPKMRHNDELREVVKKAREVGMTEAEIAELPESKILSGVEKEAISFIKKTVKPENIEEAYRQAGIDILGRDR